MDASCLLCGHKGCQRFAEWSIPMLDYVVKVALKQGVREDKLDDLPSDKVANCLLRIVEETSWGRHSNPSLARSLKVDARRHHRYLVQLVADYTGEDLAALDCDERWSGKYTSTVYSEYRGIPRSSMASSSSTGPVIVHFPAMDEEVEEW